MNVATPFHALYDDESIRSMDYNEFCDFLQKAYLLQDESTVDEFLDRCIKKKFNFPDSLTSGGKSTKSYNGRFDMSSIARTLFGPDDKDAAAVVIQTFYKRFRNLAITNDKIPEDIKKWQPLMGKIFPRNDSSEKGVGCGMLLNNSTLLTCQHVIESFSVNELYVGFNVLNFSDRVKLRDKFSVSRIIIADNTAEYDDYCRTFGIACGHDSDIAFLVISKTLDDQEFPDIGISPRVMSKSYDGKVSDVYFVGYTSGSHLKVSFELHGLSLSFVEIMETGSDLTGAPVTDGSRDMGIIAERSEDNIYVLKKEGSKPIHVTPIEGHRIQKIGSIIYKHSEKFTVNVDPLLAADHMIVSLKTNNGSSGGVYITLDGTIVGLHCGVIQPHAAQHFKVSSKLAPHLVLFLHQQFLNSFWFRIIDKQMKSMKNNIVRPSVKIAVNDYILNSTRIYGKVVSIQDALSGKENDERQEVTIQSANWCKETVYYDSSGKFMTKGMKTLHNWILSKKKPDRIPILEPIPCLELVTIIDPSIPEHSPLSSDLWVHKEIYHECIKLIVFGGSKPGVTYVNEDIEIVFRHVTINDDNYEKLTGQKKKGGFVAFYCQNFSTTKLCFVSLCSHKENGAIYYVAPENSNKLFLQACTDNGMLVDNAKFALEKYQRC